MVGELTIKRVVDILPDMQCWGRRCFPELCIMNEADLKRGHHAELAKLRELTHRKVDV
jgi:hypothetical protein